MNAINTAPTSSGSDLAVRLPKDLDRLSDLGKKGSLEVKNGTIVNSNRVGLRDGWAEQIDTLLRSEVDPTIEFNRIETTTLKDGLDDAPWNGLPFRDQNGSSPAQLGD